MDQLTLWMALDFRFCGYSVIANDSVQTLGTWIQVTIKDLNGQCTAASAVLLSLHYGMDGIPMVEI